MQTPRFPQVIFPLPNDTVEALPIVAGVSRALREAGHGSEVDAFCKEALSGDYVHVFATIGRWVTVPDVGSRGTSRSTRH